MAQDQKNESKRSPVGSPFDSIEGELPQTVFKERVDAGDNAVPAGDDGSWNPTTLGRFKIHGTLGKGGFGTVYLGFDDRLKRKVAIKVPTRVLTDYALDKFLEEARRLAQLRHAGIVTVFDVGESEGRCYIVSDYLEGQSLAKWMSVIPYNWVQAATIVAQLADALAHAHSHGTVHRDLKPSNVMMLANHQPILIDFGLAISDGEGERERPGIISGTPAYMSPEQATGRGHRIDGRTDIYSLGVMLYQLICRKQPFSSNSIGELLRQIQDDEPQPPRQIVPDIPQELEQACLKAMAKRIKDRFTTATDFANSLHEVIQKAEPAIGRAIAVPLESSPLEPEPSAPSRSTRHGIHDAERRQITTLCLALDDSQTDADETDPETFREVVQRFHEVASRVFVRYGGHLAQSLNESIQAYFGYPVAFEDSARRAVMAAMDIAAELHSLQQRSKNSTEMNVDFRIGIHTGIMITEAVDSETPQSRSTQSARHSFVGNVPRVAAGLADLGEPGMVVVSAATAQIVGDSFVYRSWGIHSGKAIGRKIELFAVVAKNETATDVEQASENPTPLVGRDHEMRVLNDRWNQAASGLGQIVLLSADAGMGKSRLLSAFRQGLAGGDFQAIDTGCSAHHHNTAFHPVSQLLKRLAKFEAADTDESKLAKLESLLKGWNLPLESVVPLMVDLVGIPLGPRYAALEGTPERRKQKTIEALVESMLVASESQPLLITIEDLHWIDPSTLQFLSVLIEQVPAAPIFLLLACRPMFVAPWPARPTLIPMMIGNLTSEQTAAVVTRIAGGRKLPTEIVDHIVAKTGGVPLFTEELTKVLLESQILEESGNEYRLARPLNSMTIPSTLQDSLMARLDHLGAAKEVAQLAAVIGRDFTFQLLAAIAPLDAETLQSELAALVNADLVHQRGFFPRARFTFKHALVQDAAYESLLRKTRQLWHRRIADVLISRVAQMGQSSPELLAHHYTEAGQTIDAIGYWAKAGLQAQERSANKEAISHFRQGLSLVATLEESADRDRLEFQFQIPLGVALLTTQGYAAAEVGPVFERARVLGQKLAEPASRFYIHWGIWAWRVVREELEICQQMADEALRLISPLDDPGLQIEALFIDVLTSFYRGEFTRTRELCEQGFPLYDEAASKLHARQTGQNVGVTMQSYWALALWHLGHPEQAIQRADRAVALARLLKHPFSLAYALCHSSWLHHHCRLSEVVRKTCLEEITLSTEQGFPFWLAEGYFHQGFASLLDRQGAEGLTSLQAGMNIFRMTGAKLSLCQFYAQMALGHLLTGDMAAALREIDEALATSAINGNVFHLAEIHRQRGEILLASSDDDIQEAEACFDKSLEIARAQQARSSELRTTVSLHKLHHQQGRPAESREALAGIYQWFNEGHDLPDLIEAKQLLDAMN